MVEDEQVSVSRARSRQGHGSYDGFLAGATVLLSFLTGVLYIVLYARISQYDLSNTRYGSSGSPSEWYFVAVFLVLATSVLFFLGGLGVSLRRTGGVWILISASAAALFATFAVAMDLSSRADFASTSGMQFMLLIPYMIPAVFVLALSSLPAVRSFCEK